LMLFYGLFAPKSSYAGKPHAGKPDIDEPHTGKPDTDKGGAVSRENMRFRYW